MKIPKKPNGLMWRRLFACKYCGDVVPLDSALFYAKVCDNEACVTIESMNPDKIDKPSYSNHSQGNAMDFYIPSEATRRFRKVMRGF